MMTQQHTYSAYRKYRSRDGDEIEEGVESTDAEFVKEWSPDKASAVGQHYTEMRKISQPAQKQLALPFEEDKDTNSGDFDRGVDAGKDFVSQTITPASNTTNNKTDFAKNQFSLSELYQKIQPKTNLDVICVMAYALTHYKGMQSFGYEDFEVAYDELAYFGEDRFDSKSLRKTVQNAKTRKYLLQRGNEAGQGFEIAQKCKIHVEDMLR